ncbi:hypothetical protein PSACC_00265 [Paramicrosporidium saccamoebae]|uniref:UBL3-like ubiquitin domain-containing protein n=1 Tax=Paramicrosporidium saccamoebae TaxID=1246581 RepID=A0A2H9TQ99_9FUNG|nr:hypothetical protein PSACC_00265 [Paramicrosporidium saccamoebae]
MGTSLESTAARQSETVLVESALLPRDTPSPTTTEEAADDVMLRLLLVSGNRCDFTCPLRSSIHQIKQNIIQNWPKGILDKWAYEFLEWTEEERAENVERLRILYHGRFLEDGITLESIAFGYLKLPVTSTYDKETKPTKQSKMRSSQSGSCCACLQIGDYHRFFWVKEACPLTILRKCSFHRISRIFNKPHTAQIDKTHTIQLDKSHTIQFDKPHTIQLDKPHTIQFDKPHTSQFDKPHTIQLDKPHTDLPSKPHVHQSTQQTSRTPIYSNLTLFNSTYTNQFIIPNNYAAQNLKTLIFLSFPRENDLGPYWNGFFTFQGCCLKYYEYKQYKKGLKVCETLLKKHPEHGESLAMKGLFLSNLNRKDEGYEHVRIGLKYSLKSHVCWHVYGLMYRADKNYDEAIKCYRNALRFDKDNGQILRELAVLQLQTRQYAALVDTRYQLLSLRPVVKLSWVSLAIAYHLNRKFEQAVGILDAIFEGFPVECDTRSFHIEQSELIFYKSLILRESGNYEAAFHAIDKSNFVHVDSLEWNERRAQLLTDMKSYHEASIIYEKLLKYNPDSSCALQGYIKCMRLQSTEDEISILSGLAKKYPRSILLQSEIMKTADLDILKGVLSNNVLPRARRGILSAFSMIRRLYKNPDYLPILQQFCEQLESSLPTESGDDLAWIHVLIAQHYSLFDGGLHGDKAVFNMECATKLKPDVPEVFLYYAKILRRLGLVEKAADCMEYASGLDRSDRFLNTKAAKYFLRAGRIDEAKRLAVLFVKKGEPEAQLQDLVEMQVLWFALEMGRAYQSKQDHAQALSYFNQIKKHFLDFYEDQFDFHNYVLRRMTLGSYISLLRYEDVISGHPEFFKAANLAVKSLLHLYDTQSNDIENGLSKLDLSGSADYLESAKYWVDLLIAFRSKDATSQRLAFEVYIRLGLLTKAARCIVLADGCFTKEAIDTLLARLPEGSPETEAILSLLKDARTASETTKSYNSKSLEVPILDKLLSR